MPNYGGFNFSFTSSTTNTPGTGTGGGGYGTLTFNTGSVYGGAGTGGGGVYNTSPPSGINTGSPYGGGYAPPGSGGISGGFTSVSSVTNPWENNFWDWRQKQQYENIDQEHQRAEYEWKTWHEPELKAAAQAEEKAALDSANKALAEMQARYMWMRSGGAGTAGMWEMGQMNLEGQALKVRALLSATSEKYMNELHTAFLSKKDDQDFAEKMAKLQEQYREQYAETVAELNDGTWWQSLGSIVGMINAFVNPPTYIVGGAIQYGGNNAKKWS